jgi:hypothetical protein
MSIKTTKFGKIITQKAEEVLRLNYKEETKIIGFTATPQRADGQGLGRAYDGLMDDVAVFNRALSDWEVASLYGMGEAVYQSDVRIVIPFEGDSKDRTYNSNDGSDTAVTYGTSYGLVKQGGDFNGSSSLIDLGNLDITSSHAFVIGFRRQSVSGYDCLFSVGTAGTRQWVFVSSLTTTLYYGFYNDDLNVAIPNDEDYHVAWGSYNATGNVHLGGIDDGTYSGSRTSGGSPNATANNFYIGRSANSATDYYSGDIDEFFFFDSAKTQNELVNYADNLNAPETFAIGESLTTRRVFIVT